MAYFDHMHAHDNYPEMSKPPPMWYEDKQHQQQPPSGEDHSTHHVPAMTSSSYTYNDYADVSYSTPSPSLKMPTNYTTSRKSAVPESSPYSRLYHESPCPSPAPSVRVGRPPKATSTTKMASYARNYRAMKKEQMRHLEIQNEDLLRENVDLRKQNLGLQEHLQKLEKEINTLRRVLDKDSAIASLVAKIGGNKGVMSGSSNGLDGVCLHLSGGRVSVEVCEECAQRVRSRNTAPLSHHMECRRVEEDPFLTPPPGDLSPLLF